MTLKRALIAFLLREPVIFRMTGTRYYIKGYTIQHKERRSMTDRLDKSNGLMFSFILVEWNTPTGSTCTCRSEELIETTSEPDKEYQDELLKKLAVI